MERRSYSGLERRQFPRLEESLPVRFRFTEPKTSRFYEAKTKDFSAGGVFILKVLFKKEIGKKLELEMDLPQRDITVKSTCEVIWMKESEEPERIDGMGIKFVHILDDLRGLISSYVSERLAILEEREVKIDLSGYPKEKLREKERRSLEILSLLRTKGALSKAQISEFTGLNMTTISNHIRGYVDKELVFEGGLDVSTGGRRPSLLELNPQYGYVLGGDLNLKEGFVAFLVTDLATQVMSRIKGKFKENRDLGESLVELVIEAIREAKVPIKKIRGLGLAIPEYRNNYLDLKGFLQRRLNLPILLEGRSNACLFAERWLDPELEKIENILYVELDGSFAMIAQGKLYHGTNKAGGRMTIDTSKEGSLKERFCWISQGCILRPEQLKGTFEDTSRIGLRMGLKVACLINLLNPEVIIVEAASVTEADVFLSSIKEAVKVWGLEEPVRGTKLLLSRLGEDAAALGTAALVIREVFAQI